MSAFKAPKGRQGQMAHLEGTKIVKSHHQFCGQLTTSHHISDQQITTNGAPNV